MKILLCHNFYQQPGGEDQVFVDEARLLAAHGHEVVRYTQHNDDIGQMNKLAVAAKTVWNNRTYRELLRLMANEQFDVLHCTNTFPLISPAVYYAARKAGVPVVQSLHNYRLLCPNALFLRDGAVCEDCVGKLIAWPAIRHGCYRGSRAGSAVLAGMLAVHKALRTYRKTVAIYVALSHFSRDKFIAGGLPAERIRVKPNFVGPDPLPGDGRGGYAIFVGRLSAEKGIDTLLAAWTKLPGDMPLWIVGDGPLADQVQQAAARDTRIRWLGRREQAEVCQLIGDANCLVMPSACYEHCPRALLEAYAKGTPVVASRLGAMAEFVLDHRTGLHFTAGDAADLAEKLQVLRRDPAQLARLRLHARQEYAAKYTAERNIAQLEAIYAEAIAARPTAGGHRAARSAGVAPSTSTVCDHVPALHP